MPVIVEKDGHQRHMGDPQYKRLKGQGKLNGFSLVKSVSFAKPANAGQAAKAQDKITLPEEVTKFQQKTVAEREQDALNKAYVSMGEKGRLFDIPEDYTGDPSLLKISELPSAVKPEAVADSVKPEADAKVAPATKSTQNNAEAPKANQPKKSS
jgi:hypothetical protein